jgi:GNAT superfamily N-acetyltransferase
MMLQNERSFDEVFCDVLKADRFSLFYNSEFSDDAVFNHAVISDDVLGSDVSMDDLEPILEEIRIQASKKQVPTSVFLENFWKNAVNAEKAAVNSGYRVAGKMDSMSKSVNGSTLSSQGNTRLTGVTTSAEVRAWNSCFMRSFDIPSHWEDELLRREQSVLGDPSTKLLSAFESEDSTALSGCLLLHRNPSECMGVYCVGTVPELRGRGVARALMAQAESIAVELKCKVLTLQTVRSDGFTPMYQKMGYTVEFDRDVLRG